MAFAEKWKRLNPSLSVVMDYSQQKFLLQLIQLVLVLIIVICIGGSHAFGTKYSLHYSFRTVVMKGIKKSKEEPYFEDEDDSDDNATLMDNLSCWMILRKTFLLSR